MAQELTDEVTGLTIRTPDGETVGTVSRVEEGVAYVEPDPDAPDTVTATLGWNDVGEADESTDKSADGDGSNGEYPLPRTAIDTVEDEAIRLRRGDAEAGRGDDTNAHETEADLARGANEDDRSTEETRERAREAETERDVHESLERETAAEEEANPNAHRDEEPFDD